MTSKLLNINEAAGMLKVHPETLRRWDKNGKLVAIKIGSRGDRRYKEEDILKLVQDQKLPWKYKDYEIIPHPHGFDHFVNRLGLITKYIVHGGNNILCAFAFAVPGLEHFATPDKTEDLLLEMAEDEVKKTIDSGPLEDHKSYTFQYAASDEKFHYVNKPEWWEEFNGNN